MKHIALTLLSLSFLGACSAQTVDVDVDVNVTVAADQKATQIQSDHKHGADGVRTVKPGPAVRIATELREPVSPGGAGALDVTFSEIYGAGTLSVRATTSEGLTLITTNDATSFDMSSGSLHEWTVFFDAPTAGRHYVNFHVSIDTAFGRLTRKSAAIVQVGKETGAAAPSKSVVAVQTNADGEPVIMMQAQETIIQDE